MRTVTISDWFFREVKRVSAPKLKGPVVAGFRKKFRNVKMVRLAKSRKR
jgi:hypothetical protein